MSIGNAFMGLLFIIPSLILSVVGIVLTARARGEHGRAATFGLTGCVLLLLGAILQGVWQVLLPAVVESAGYEMFALVNAVAGFVFMMVGVIGTGLLIAGVVARRTPPQREPYQQQAPGWQQPPPPGQWPTR
ncbi:hypothetical protein ACWDLG_43285 [Nonomuraea sp. NPDC003727]|uniref:hypothetical protein n=1 Tax=Nonomuraea sp. NPDC003804 TaxID=3154547 RepID=UPI0033AB5AF2